MRVRCVPDENASFGEKLSYKLWKAKESAKEWYKQHKLEVLIFGPIVIGTAGSIFKIIGKRINLAKENELKDLYVYDRSLGHYWKLRRELGNDEWLSINARMKDGEKLGDILEQLKVLK